MITMVLDCDEMMMRANANLNTNLLVAVVRAVVKGWGQGIPLATMNAVSYTHLTLPTNREV